MGRDIHSARYSVPGSVIGQRVEERWPETGPFVPIVATIVAAFFIDEFWKSSKQRKHLRLYWPTMRWLLVYRKSLSATVWLLAKKRYASQQ